MLVTDNEGAFRLLQYSKVLADFRRRLVNEPLEDENVGELKLEDYLHPRFISDTILRCVEASPFQISRWNNVLADTMAAIGRCMVPILIHRHHMTMNEVIDYALDGERKDVADLLILFIKRLLQDEEAHVSSEREEVLAIKKLLRTKIYLREFVVAEIDKRVQLDVEVLTLMSQLCQIRQSQHGNDRSLMTNEQVVLQKFLWLLQTSDPNTLIHAVKVVANLAAKEANQEPIMAQAGISLLAMAAAEDPRTLCMVAGAIANICGNNKLLVRLMSEGVIETLFGMVRRSSDPDVLSQVARGISNFANCEIRAAVQGKSGRTLLIKDDALLLIVQNANNEASLIRRHTELAVCHLVQHEVNARSSIQLSAKIEHPVILRSLKDSSNLSILINYSIL